MCGRSGVRCLRWRRSDYAPPGVMPSPPIDIVVMSLRNRGATVEEIAAGRLSPREALGALMRVASRFDPPHADRRQPVEA